MIDETETVFEIGAYVVTNDGCVYKIAGGRDSRGNWSLNLLNGWHGHSFPGMHLRVISDDEAYARQTAKGLSI